MDESEDAFLFDGSIWEHIEHIDFTILIPVSEIRSLDIIACLQDIYKTIDRDKEEAKQLISSVVALFVASKYDKADIVWEEFIVRSETKNLDLDIRRLLREKY
jgi:hypothetical protein